MNMLGIDVGATTIKVSVCSAPDILLTDFSLPTRAHEGPDAVLDQIHEGISQGLALCDTSPLGIGLGMPGTIDHHAGTVSWPPNLPGWGVRPLLRLLEDRWKLPVRIENDANCAALGEARFGAGRGHPSFLGVTLGTGIGAGIIVDGHIFHGTLGFAGELGHLSIDGEGALCKCGGQGCVEAYLGIEPFLRHARDTIGREGGGMLSSLVATTPEALTPKRIAEAARQGDPQSIGLFAWYARHLAMALASAINLLDLPVIILGGGIAGAGAPLFAPLQSELPQRVLAAHRDRIRVLPAERGNQAGMLGAASLFF